MRHNFFVAMTIIYAIITIVNSLATLIYPLYWIFTNSGDYLFLGWIIYPLMVVIVYANKSILNWFEKNLTPL